MGEDVRGVQAERKPCLRMGAGYLAWRQATKVALRDDRARLVQRANHAEAGTCRCQVGGVCYMDVLSVGRSRERRGYRHFPRNWRSGSDAGASASLLGTVG